MEILQFVRSERPPLDLNAPLKPYTDSAADKLCSYGKRLREINSVVAARKKGLVIF